jgi:hypothetical protein
MDWITAKEIFVVDRGWMRNEDVGWMVFGVKGLR